MSPTPEYTLGHVGGAREEKNVWFCACSCCHNAARSRCLSTAIVYALAHSSAGQLPLGGLGWPPGSRLQVGYRFMPQVQDMCSAPWSPWPKAVSQCGQAGVQFCSLHLF